MILEIKDYTKKLKSKTVLENINLKLGSGHIYGFYGRNGSGKTMLFRAIATLIFPTEGDILIDGKSIINDDFNLQRIGLLLENPDFYFHLNGLENLSMLYEINHKRDDEQIKKYLKMVGLENDYKKKYKEFSLGMKQKLRFAQAIMENQELIILDEPTNGLDEDTIHRVHEIILNLVKEDKLILIASHNKEDLKLLCDKVFQIKNGKIVGELNL